MASCEKAINSSNPRTTKLHRLNENTGAVSIDLTVDEQARIEKAASDIKIEGARYPENLQKLVGK